MKSYWHLVISALIGMTCCAASAGAETRYISDQLVVSLREKPQASAQPVTHLKTDTAVEILGETGDYIKVQTEAGEIGYIKQSYLTANTPKSEIIKQLQRERDRLTAKAGELQQKVTSTATQSNESQQEIAAQLSENQKQLSELQMKFEESQAALARTSQDYQTLQKDASAVIEITEERDQLRVTNQEMTAAIAKLEGEVESLMMTGIIKWFLAGGGVLFLGWMIGKLSGRRRSRF